MGSPLSRVEDLNSDSADGAACVWQETTLQHLY